MRRRMILAGLATAPVLAFVGCGNSSLLQPRIQKKGAQVHAFMTASVSYSFMNGHAAQWAATVDRVESDVLPLMAAAQQAGIAMRLRIEPWQAQPGYETYHVHLDFKAADGKTATVEGTYGMDEGAHAAMSQEASALSGISADVIRDGHFAVYGMVNMMTALNVSNDSLQRHAFAMVVLKKKLEAGEKADWFDPNRPKEESFKDIETSLAIVAGHYSSVQTLRAEVMAMVAMFQANATPEAKVALNEQVSDSRTWAKDWRATHSQPSAEDFGAGMPSLTEIIPLLDHLDKVLGFMQAATKVAQGIATGSPQMTLQGLADLAPDDSTVKTVLEGTVAITKGDISGTIDAIAELTGKTAEVDAVKGRLGRVQKALAMVRGKSPKDIAKDLAKDAGKKATSG